MSILYASDKSVFVDMSLCPSAIDTNEMIGINLVFNYGKNYPQISNNYDGIYQFEISIILDSLFEYLSDTKPENDYISVTTQDEYFALNIEPSILGGYKIFGQMDTPAVIFYTSKDLILKFMKDLSHEFRKNIPKAEMTLIEKALKIKKELKSNKKLKQKFVTNEEWLAFCKYSLYIDESDFLSGKESFKALADLKKKLIIRD